MSGDLQFSLMEGRAARIMAWAAFAIVLLEDALYLGLIRTQANTAPDAFTVPFVGGYLLLMAALLGASLMRRHRIVAIRTALRGGAAGGLLVLGILALFSIGLPLVIAGALAAGATVRTLSRPHWTPSALSGVAAAAIAVAVLVAGFEVTERMIICPSRGFGSGGGYGLITGAYHYQCVDGRLNFQSGACNHGGATIDSNGNVVSTSSC